MYYILLLALSAAALAAIYITSKKSMCKNNYINFIIIPVNNQTKSIELLVRQLINHSKNQTIVLSLACTDEEIKQVCMLLENEFQQVYICENDNLTWFVNAKLSSVKL